MVSIGSLGWSDRGGWRGDIVSKEEGSEREGELIMD